MVARNLWIRGGGLGLVEPGFGFEDARLHRVPLALVVVAELAGASLLAVVRSLRAFACWLRGQIGFDGSRRLPLLVAGERDRAALAVEREDLRRDAVEQVAVVRHEHERARELEQALLEHLERGDVEVVRGLVEQQQVGRLEDEPGEHRARLLAAGEPAHGRLELLGAEQEALRPAGDVDGAAPEDHGVAVRAERPRQRDGGIEARAVLVEDHDLEGFRVLDRACVGLLLAGEQTQQRALAAAVRAQQAESRAGPEHQVEPAHDPPLAVAVPDVLGDQQALRPPLRGREVDVDRGRLARARRDRRAPPGASGPRRSAPGPCACGRGPCARASRARRARGS